jgi:SAM-dependent methyltransferase
MPEPSSPHDEIPPAEGPGDRLASLAGEWDRRYASVPRVFRAEPDESLAELVSPLSPGRAVDLGAGEGRNSLWLATHGWDVVAVDLSSVALERLRGFASADGLTIEAVHGDLVDYLRSGPAERVPFDLAVLAYVHPGPDERSAILEAAAGSLVPGGYLFVVGHHVSSFGVVGPPDAARLYREDDVTAALKGLEIIRLQQRRGASDVQEPGTDLVVWARRPAATGHVG